MTHREQKKQQTKQAFINSAYRLFAEKGYDATTLADIAAGANCAPRTFFQYFTSKEELLLVGIDKLWSGLASALSDRPAGLSALDAACEWMETVLQEHNSGDHPFTRTLEQEAGNRGISIKVRTQLYTANRMKEILAPEIAKDLGLSPDAARPRLIAIAAASVLDAYHNDTGVAKLAPAVFLDEAFSMLKAMY